MRIKDVAGVWLSYNYVRLCIWLLSPPEKGARLILIPAGYKFFLLPKPRGRTSRLNFLLPEWQPQKGSIWPPDFFS